MTNDHYVICEWRRPRAACASAQFIQVFRNIIMHQLENEYTGRSWTSLLTYFIRHLIFRLNLLLCTMDEPYYMGSNMVFHALTFARSRGRCWKSRPEAAVFNISLGTWRMLMHWKTMFGRYYCVKVKAFATFRVISCTILFRLFTDVSRTPLPRTMLVLGPRSTDLVTVANLWPRYDHIESCVAVH